MVSSLELIKGNYPKTGTFFEKYLRPVSPKLDISKVSMDLLVGSERESLVKTGFGGEASLLLSYKGHGGAIACFELTEGTLSIIQFKGIHSRKGYRLHKGLGISFVYADELVNIALILPDIERVNIPEVTQGIEGARDIETALANNRTLAILVGQRMAQSRAL